MTAPKQPAQPGRLMRLKQKIAARWAGTSAAKRFQSSRFGLAYMRRSINKKKVAAMSPRDRRKYFFSEVPIWKSLLIMSGPTMLQMLLFGSYTFADTILSINFASDSYVNPSPGIHNFQEIIPPSDQVRLFMTSVAPIANLLNAFGVLFAVGLATRLSVNLGAGNFERAKATMRTGMMTSQLVSFALIPVLIFATKPWIESQFSRFSPEAIARLRNEGFNYIVIIIAGYPIQAFWSTSSALFRVDGRNREVLFISIVNVAVNLTLDWVFMGPAGMAVDGGAWATFISNVVAMMLSVAYIVRLKSDIVNLRYMFGLKFSWIYVIGIAIAGVTPFMRQISVSITQAFEFNINQHVSQAVYGNTSQFSLVGSAAVQVAGLLFPAVFSFTQAARPIISYNYGAKAFSRVNQAYYWTCLYAVISGILIYIFSAFILGDVFLTLLRVEDKFHNKALNVLRVYMSYLPIFAASVPGLVLFSSTDRITMALLASVLSGLILIWPMVYGFQAIAEANTQFEYAYWFLYPTNALIATIFITIGAQYTLKHLPKNHTTLDERIEAFTARFERKSKGSKAKR